MDFLRTYWPAVLGFVLGLAFFFYVIARSPEGYQNESTNTFHEGKPGPTGSVHGGKK